MGTFLNFEGFYGPAPKRAGRGKSPLALQPVPPSSPNRGRELCCFFSGFTTAFIAILYFLLCSVDVVQSGTDFAVQPST